MSAAINNEIDGIRERIQALAATPISMGTMKQYKRSAEQITYDLVNVLDEVNAQHDEVSPSVMDALKKAVTDMLAKKVEGEK